MAAGYTAPLPRQPTAPSPAKRMHTNAPLLALVLGATATATATATAQNDYDLDKITSGRVGGPLTMQVTGAPPNQPILWVPSTTAGPTPLNLVDPFDPRVMEVGIDLLDAAVAQLTDGAGGTTLSLGLPPNAGLSGILLHWQTVEVLLGTPFFGALGNAVVTQIGRQDAGVAAPDALSFARAFSAAFFDRDNNGGAGDLVVAGGGTGTLTAATGLSSSERWDFRAMRAEPAASMGTARALHLAVPLTDNRVLIIGGVNSTGATLATCEIYDPTTNAFSPTGSMATARTLHAACRLADGRVMVAGGTSTLQPDVVAALNGTLNTCEIWNPATGTWTGTANLGGYRLAPALTLLSTNQVMVSGGVAVTTFLGIPLSAQSVTTVQRWNPATGTWSSGAAMPAARAGHHYNQVTLLDGRVLMSGGVNLPSLATATSAAPIANADIYNPATNTWQAGTMGTARALHGAVRLNDARVVVTGGAQGTLLAPTSIADVHVFDPGSNTWTPAAPLLAPRASHVAALLPDDTMVLLGGQGASTTVTTIETLRFQ
jgi:hypothetical protein